MKKTTRDIIILYMCTINDNHMIYGSPYMVHFYPTNNPKNQNSEKIEKPSGDR